MLSSLLNRPPPKPRLSPLLACGEAVVQKQEPSLQTARRGPIYRFACPVSLTRADFLVRELEADARSLLRVLLPRLSSVHRTGPALLLEAARSRPPLPPALGSWT